MAESPYDPRRICNLILANAMQAQRPISNLALQKLLYFSHALYLIKERRPLVMGYFEAWQYGPVHPAAYTAFRSAGDKPITFFAEKKNPLTGAFSPLPPVEDPILTRFIARIVDSYGRLSPGRLVEISHAKGAPWHHVVAEAKSKMTFGLRISDSLIVERFRYHIVSLENPPILGEPSEDTPFA